MHLSQTLNYHYIIVTPLSFFFWKGYFHSSIERKWNTIEWGIRAIYRVESGRVKYILNRQHDIFLNLKKLHNREGIRFNNDTRDVHFLGKDDPVFQSNGFSCISRVVGWDFCLLLLWHGHWNLRWLLWCMRVFHLRLLHHQH